MDTQTWIQKALYIHGDKYLYTKSVYVKSYINITVICLIHGDFEIRPSNHTTLKRGCPSCSKTAADYTRNSKEEFIEKAILKHGNKFDYSAVDYKNNTTKVKIICPVHGLFEQLPANHYKYDCLACSREQAKERLKQNENSFSKSGYKALVKDKLCTLYLIKCWDSNEVFYKIGITSHTVGRRFHTVKAMPYTFEILKEIKGAPEVIWTMENNLKKKLISNYIPKIKFAGSARECYSDLNEILDMFKDDL